MTSRPLPQCVVCAHWISPLDREGEKADELEPVQLCSAFPDGIPDEIWWNKFDHRQSHEGDHGIRWEADGDEKYPEWALVPASEK